MALNFVHCYDLDTVFLVISPRVTQESFLPGLRALLTDIRELGLDGASNIQTLISEFEAKLGAHPNR